MSNEAKAEETVAEVQVTEAPAAETPAAKPEEAAAEEEELDVEAGYLQKRGTNPINPWNKRFFAFGDEPLDINNLQKFHRRNERRVKAVAPAKEEKKDKAPEAEAASAEATSSDAAKAPAADEAKEAPKTVQDVYEEANKDLLVNIAHATQTGKGLLFYHRSSNSMDRKTPLGIINLRDVNSVEQVEKSSKNRSFVVSTKNRDYHFSAESPQKANGWVKSIKDKSDEAKAAGGPYDSPQFNDIYQQLVARQAFEHAKNSANIVSDNEINSDGEPDDIEIEGGKAIVKKRNKKSFLGFSAVSTSHEIKKEGGITTEVSSEQKKDLTHVQDENVDALKTHESQNAVSHTTDAPATSSASASSSQEAPKSPKSGGFKLFGKKSPKTEEPPAPPAEHKPLTVDEAKSQALKAVDDAVEASKVKAAEAKAAANSPPPPPPVPEKKPSFFASLFQKKPAPPPPPPVVPNEETIVISNEKSVSDVVTAEGEATSQSNAGFFSRVTKGKDTNEVEVKSSALSTEDVITAEGSTHVAHIEGTDASVENTDGDTRVDLSTTDETVATADKVERKPSLLKRLSGAVRATITAPAAAEGEAKAEDAAPAAAPVVVVKETIVEETTTEAELAVKETKVTEVTKETAVEAAA